MALRFPRESHQRWGIQAGFTLIELMVVMALMVTLATLGLVQYRQSVICARESVLKDDLFKLRDAIDQYYADKNQYPPTLDDLVSAGYLRHNFVSVVVGWLPLPQPLSRSARAKRRVHVDGF